MDAPTPVEDTSAAQAPDGRTVGRRYTLQSSVGSGGMGTVWRAFDELLRREVAVKEVLLPPGIPAPERSVLCERTLREARAAAALNHPSVIRVYDVVNDGDQPWIVMELLDAASLADTLRDEGPLPYDRVAEIGLAVLGALEAAHRVGVLHRDVKPGNVLLGVDGRVTLTDFGVARSPNESPLTSTGLLLGSPQYIAPERARGRPFGPPSDLFSLGATLYTAVEGRPPFDRGEPLPTMTAVVVEPPDQMAFAGPMAPVLLGLLEKEPQERWDTEKTRNALRTVLGGGRITALDGRPSRQSNQADRLAGLRRRREESGQDPTDPPGWPVPPSGSAPSAGAAAPGWPVPPTQPPVAPPPLGSPPMGSPAPGQRPRVEGTAAMAVGPFTTEGLPSLPPTEAGNASASNPSVPDRPGFDRSNPGEAYQARDGRYAGTASVRGAVPQPNQQAHGQQAPGQQAPGQQAPGQQAPGTQFSGSARVPGTAPTSNFAAYGGGYGEPYNAPPPPPTSADPRRTAYLSGHPGPNGHQGLDGRAGNIGGHTMIAPQPSIPRSGDRRKTVLIGAALVLVLALIGVVSYLVNTTSSPTTHASASSTVAAAPTGLALSAYSFPQRGFTLKAPTSWKKSESGTFVNFDSTDPSNPQYQEIRALVEGGTTPALKIDAAERVQQKRANGGKISAFRTVRKGPSTRKLSGQDTWEWEWTYTPKGKPPRHLLWRVAVVNGTAYSLSISAPETRYSALIADYNRVTASFALTGG